jgi:hypothetical protein
MPDAQDTDELLDAETDFRRRLAVKLAARGYEGAALEARIDELLRTGVKLRLNIPEILGELYSAPPDGKQ